MAPLLDRIGGAAVVNGAGTRQGSIRLWVDLPTEQALVDHLRATGAPESGTGTADEADEADRQTPP